MAGHDARWMPFDVAAPLDRFLYDVRLRATMPRTIDPRIVIVDIDENSLNEVGRWPWPRDRMARLVDRLFDNYHVRLLGFDIVMAEPDNSSGLRGLEQLGAREFKDNAQYHAGLARLRPALDYDEAFAASLRGRPVILGYYLSNEGASSGAMPAPALASGLLAGHNIAITTWRNFGANLPRLQQAAADAGHFNPIIDPDGSIRRVPLLARLGKEHYQSFSLALVRAYLNGAAVLPRFGDTGADGDYAAVEALDLSNGRSLAASVPVDQNVAAWVPYRGPAGSFKYVSAADVLAGRVAPAQLAGRIVIVGTSAPGLRDARTTPVGEVYPGMEVHANLVSGMLDGRVKQRPQYADAADLVLLLGVGLLMIFGFPWRSPLWSGASTAALILAMALGDLALWQYAGWILAPAGALILCVLLYGWNTAYGYFIEARAKGQILRRFGQYVPPELVDKMSLDPSRYNMDSRKAELTVLFSDVRDFTSISERLAPEQLARFMNEYLTAMTLVIRRHGGTLDKYVGDAIVAFWGAPMDDPHHAQHAVLAALEMQDEVVRLNQSLVPQGWPALQVGIGINTGLMTVGDMGSSVRLAYTVMGDAVNLGARLESKSKDYGVGIIVGQSTQAASPGIAYRELDRVQVKGKDEAVTIYQPLGRHGERETVGAAELASWQEVLRSFRERDWTGTEIALRVLLKDAPGQRLYQLYLQRVLAFQLAPPGPDWGGVTRFDTK
ncbi:MAG: adenylate/guanylate cyclase domain-containing protein [Pseudomonadota bacterium]|nr:adenylate/guanylate cyclase domain-containing protein [Pseudomonadota bacterium]